MKKFIFIVLLLCNICMYSQRSGLKLPEIGVVDSIPTTSFIPGRPRIDPTKDLSMLPQIPAPGNQKSQGSCVGWAIGYGLKSYQERLETGDNSLTFSPSFIYNSIKSQYDNCSVGITFEKALTFLKNRGCCFSQNMLYDEFDCTTQPNNSAKNEARKYVIRDYKKIYASKTIPISDVSEIEQQIFFGNPVLIGVWIDKKLGNYMDDHTQGKKKWIWQENGRDTDIESNYHAMLCVGYDRINEVFTILNSYGPHSGYEGYVFMSYKAFKQGIYEAYYTTDANNKGLYKAATIQSKQKADSIWSSVNYFKNTIINLKQGYFIDVNENLRLNCTYLSKRKNKVILNLIDIRNDKELLIGSYIFSEGDAYSIVYNSQNIYIQFEKIDFWGLNAFINLEIFGQ